MNEQEIREILEESQALKEGHFLLTSGLHSPGYVDKFQILKRPVLAAPLLKEMASRWSDKGIELVVGPAVGGIIIAYEVARHLGTPSIFLEREDGNLVFKRGFDVKKGEKVLVVDDIVTTGGSVREACDVVTKLGGDVVGVGLMVDRSGGKESFGAPMEALLTLDIETYSPDECPLCANGTELQMLGRTGKGK